MPEKKIVIVSNPFHARAEYLCKMHLHNQFDKQKLFYQGSYTPLYSQAYNHTFEIPYYQAL